jgi:hypothetical protein
MSVTKHPYAVDFAKAFREITSGQDYRAALSTVHALTKRPVEDPWHRELSNALGVCVDLILSGKLPAK